MSLNEEINHLIYCCHHLECDKVTERRKNAEKLKNLLNLDAVIKWLHAQNHQQKDINFTMIFKCVQGYLIKESEVVRKKYNSLSSLSPLGDPKLAYSAKLLRHVVEVANKNEPMIKCQELVESVNRILNENFYCHHFASVFMEVLSTYVLKYKKYVEIITSENCKELLLSCIKLYNKNEKISAICVQVMHVMKKLIKCIIQQCPASRHEYLVDFFKTSIKDIRDECSSSVIDNFLWSIDHYSQWQLASSCDLIYDLAKDALPSIIVLLRSRKISHSSFSSAISFCLLQVKTCCVDQPCNFLAIQPDYENMMEILKHMFIMLHLKISSHCDLFFSKNTVTTESTSVTLASTLLHIFIAFKVQDDFLPVQETNTLHHRTPSSHIPPHSSPWLQIIQLLSSDSGNSKAHLIWLKIVDCLLMNFPDDLASSDVTSFVDCLYGVLSNAKNEDILSAAFHVLASLLETSVFLKIACNDEFSFWPRLWEISKRQACLINLSQSQSSQIAFEVMTLMIKLDSNSKHSLLKKCDTSLANTWPVLCLSVLPSQSIILFLVTLLKEKIWVETTGEVAVSSCCDVKLQYPLRCTILEWLLACKDVVGSRSTAIAKNANEESADNQTVYKVPNFLLTFWSDDGNPPKITLVAGLISALCSFSFTYKNDQEDAVSNEREGKQPTDQKEKLLLDSVCKRVQDLACSLISSINENLSNLSTSNEPQIGSNDKTILLAIYSTHLVAYVSLKLEKGFCFNLETIYKILEKSIRLTEAMLLNHCCDNASVVSKIVDHFHEFIQSLCTSSCDFSKNACMNQVLLQVKQLCFSLLNWSLTHFGDSAPVVGTLNSTLHNDSSVLDFADKFVNTVCTGQKRLLGDDDIMSQPPAKYSRLAHNKKADGFSENVHSLSHESGQSEYLSNICEKSIMVCKNLCDLHKNHSLIVDIFNAVIAADNFDPLNAKHTIVYMNCLKVFSDLCNSLKWIELREIIFNLKDILRNHYRNQVIYCLWLKLVPRIFSMLLKYPGQPGSNECLTSLLTHLETIEKLVKGNQCNDEVRLAMIHCLAATSKTCSIFTEGNFFSHLTKYEVCAKLASFSTDANMTVIMACAKASCNVFQLAEDESALSKMTFYEKALELFKKVRESTLNTISNSTDQPWKALSYVYGFLEMLRNLIPYPSHNIEHLIAYETCYFASSASLYFAFGKDQKFLSLVKKMFCAFEKHRGFSARNSFFDQHLKYILLKWPIGDNWNSFPYYFFKASSLKTFFIDHVNDALPILLINCLCNKRNTDVVINLFKDYQLVNVIPTFVGLFLACVYGRGSALKKDEAFDCAIDIIQNLYLISKSQTSLEDILYAGVPKFFSESLYFFFPNHNDDMPTPLPFILNEAAVQACFSTILEFQTNGKFAHSEKNFSANSLFKYLNFSAGVLQEFLLGMRGLLQAASNYQEQQRLLLVYRYVWNLLRAFPNVEGDNSKQVVVASTMFALTSHLNNIIQQVTVVHQPPVLHELSNVATSYLDMLFAVYEDSLSATTCTDMLCGDTIVLNVCCTLIYIGHALSLDALSSEHKNLSESLQKFLSLIARDQFANEMSRIILLCFPSLNFAKYLLAPPQSNHFFVPLLEIITKITEANLFTPACSVMIEGLLHRLLKRISNLGDAHASVHKSLFAKFYIKFASSPVHKLHKNAFGECVEAFQLVSLNKSCLMCSNSKNHPIREALLALCDIYLAEEAAKANVAHTCLLNLRRSEKLMEFFKGEINLPLSSPYYHLLSSYFNLSNDASKLAPVTCGPKSFLDSRELWTCYQEDYKLWLCDLTCSLTGMCTVDYLHCLVDICRQSSSICQHILPHVCLLLMFGSAKEIMVQFLNTFFASAITVTDNRAYEKIELLSCMLDVVEWIRTYRYNASSQSSNLLKVSQSSTKKKNVENEDLLSGVNFLLVSEVAILCQDPIAALLYLEIWAGSIPSHNPSNQVMFESHSVGTKCLLAAVQQSNSGEKAGKLATSAYTMLNELDALRACYAITSSSSFSLASLCEKENRWLAALEDYDLNVFDDNLPHGKVFRCLQECGFGHVSRVYAQNLDNPRSPNSNAEIEELCYKSAWQCGQWDKAVFMTSTNSTSGFHKLFYNHFVSLHLLQPNNFKWSLTKLRSLCVKSLSDRQRFVNFEQLNRVIVELECLKETQIVYQMLASCCGAEECCASWKQLTSQQVVDGYGFHESKFLMEVRASLLKIFGETLSSRHGQDHSQVLETQALYYLECIDFACKSARIQHAKQTLQQLTKVVERMTKSKGQLQHSHQWWDYKLKFEKASLLWHQKEEAFALSALQSVLKDVKQYIEESTRASETLLLASILQTAGVWFDESKYEGASVIMNDYLKEGINLLEKLNSVERDNTECTSQLVASHSTLAKFADQQLQEVLIYKSSQDYAEKCELASSPSVQLRQVGHSMSKKTGIIIQKNLNIDRKELNEVERKEKDFLVSALRSYIRCLQLSDSLDTLLHRVCSLWFDHNDDEQVNQCIMESHCKLPSYKYVCLSYQLAARLSTADMNSSYAQLIEQILIRTAVDHPHHTLPVLLAIVNAHKDDEMQHSKSKNKVDATKSAPVASVLQTVRRQNQSLLAANEKLADVYIELANFDAAQWRNQPMKLIEFPRTLTINQLCNTKSRMCVELNGVVIPVFKLPLDRRARYEQLPDQVLFSHFHRGFQTCGGINIPKVVVAVAVDGTRKKHLVKGKDDLRQDAVMQQVFEMVNTLLLKLSKHDALSIRGYKVVPLTQQSGLVEWCEGTLPIGGYLVGNPVQNLLGAHARFRPDDLPVLTCRKKLMSVAKHSIDTKYKTFVAMCSKFSPVFRNFFIEKFPAPLDWFYARQRYTQSVAVSSMIGYMLGLGDRHVQNILIDTNTAEVVHIDLGVAFEQGRCLPTPETVPFRLTRDIVDGMGLTGVEGSFRRCCEKTMTLLRSSFDVIIPIMEVLLHDPLHDWTIPPYKATCAQKKEVGGDANAVLRFSHRNTSGHPTNKLAARALLKVKEKLKGCENGSSMSVGGQVNMLIQQAMDPHRLCQLFAGWQPYL